MLFFFLDGWGKNFGHSVGSASECVGREKRERMIKESVSKKVQLSFTRLFLSPQTISSSFLGKPRDHLRTSVSIREHP